MVKKVVQINFRAVALLLLGYALLSIQNSFGQATQTFSSSGSFTVPAGVTAITVEAWGGGGAGGGATGNSSAGGGGAGGSYVKNIGYTVIPGNAYTVTVGTGGVGSTTAGSSGGDSWFNSISAILAKGGLGGALAASNNQSSAGATALTSGNIGATSPFSYYGGAGGTGGANGASGGGGGGSAGSGSNGNNAIGLTGGLAVAGGGAGANGSSTSGNGTSAANGGGGAGGRTNSNTNVSGGSGGNGKLIISWTCPTYSLSSTSAVSPICISAGSSLITLSSSAAGLPVGSYTVTYSRSAPAATGLTAAMTITTAGTGNFTATGLTTAGSSTITVTGIASEACSNLLTTLNTATVTVADLPQVSAFSGNTICSGVTGQLTLTTSSGTGPFVVVYNPGSISKNLVVSGTSFAVSSNPTITSTYTLVSVTDNNGCIRSSGFTDPTATITVNDPPAITFSPVSPAAVCSGTGTRTISVTATGFGLTYQWLKNGVALTNTAPYSTVTTSALTITNPAFTENGAAFSVVVTGSCAPTTVTSSSAVLTVNALPISNNGSQTICSTMQSNFDLTSLISNGVSGTYSWVPNSNANISGELSGTGSLITNTLSNSSAINQIVTYTVTPTSVVGSCVGAPFTVLITVSLSPLPQVSAFSGNTICSGVAGQLTLTTSSGTGPFVVVYNPGSISKNSVASGTLFNVSPNPIVTSTYTLVSVTDNNGCIRSSGFADATATITVNDPPAITFSPVSPAAVCSGTGTRTISVTATGLGLSYQWLKNGVALTNTAPYSTVTTSALTITNPAYTENGASFSVLVTGSCAPTTVTSSPAVLTVNALPIVSNSGNASICIGKTTTLSPTTGGTWVSGSTAIATVNNSGLVTGISVGTVDFTFTQTSTGCNSTTPSIIVATTPNPVVEFTQGVNDHTAAISVCGIIGGGSQNDIDIFSGNPGGSATLQWQVSIDNGVTWINAPGPTSSSIQYVLDPLYTFYESVAGVYLFRILITDNACTGISNSITLTVTGVSTLTAGVVATNQTFCSSGNPVAFTSVSAPTGGSGGFTYQWQSSIDNINFSNIAGATTPVYDAPIVIQTTYYRRVVISGGCSKASNIITVTVNAPTPIITGSINGQNAVCVNSTGLTYSMADIIPTATTYTWLLPTGWVISSGQGTTTIIVSAGATAGSGNISVTASNLCGTSAAITKAVSINSLPTVTGVLSVCTGTTTQLTGSAVANANTPWISSSTGVASINNTGLVTAIAEGTSIITYNNSNGCSSTATINVNPLPAVIPSANALSICFNTLAQSTSLTYTNSTNSPTSYSIVWDASPVNSFSVVTNVALTGGAITVAIPANTLPTIYTGSLTVKNANGCVSSPAKTFTVSVNAPITITTQPSTTSFCLGSNSSISLAVTGTLPTYQWQLSSSGIGGTYTNLLNSGIYSGVTSSSLNLIAPPIGLSSNFYRVSVNGTCGGVISEPIALKFGNVWIGKISSNWNDPNNWSAGILPSSNCSNVLIPNQINQPTLSSSPDAVINNLIIDPGAIVTVTNAAMKMAGTITNNGLFNVGNGTLEFNGISPQNIAGNLFVGNSIKNLTVSNVTGLTVSSSLGSLMITGDLSFGNVNNSTLNTGDNIVLASTATATARVTDITNNGINTGNKFSGKVTVERYFPARRAWRLVTAPLSGAGNIFSTWQNKGVFAPGKGTFVTGPGASLLSNGMDPSPLNNTSLKIGSALSPIINTLTTNLSTSNGNADNKGFFIFVRGDRTSNNLAVNYCNTTTIKSAGILQTGDQQFEATPTVGAFTLIGNPYASPVDFSKLIRTNLSNRFYAWDPYLGNDQGGYVVIDDMSNSGNYTATPSSPGGQTKLIESSQAIFVITASAATASIKFTETTKSSSNLQGLFRPVTEPLYFKTNLYLLNDNGTSTLADGNLIQFDDYFNAGVDMQDAIKLSNVYETIGLANGTTSLAINRRPLLASRDTIFLNFSRNRQKKYQFEFVAGKIQQDNLAGFLEDQYLKKLTPLTMDGITKVDFEISSNPLSAASNRFRVLFSPSVSFTKINATVLGNDIAVEWEVSDEYNSKSYDIERSSNGVSFTKLDSSLACGNGKKLVSYAWLDKEPLPGYYYYRIRSLSNNAVVGYSKVVKVKMNRSTPELYVFPNPVTEDNIQIQMNKMPPGIYRVRLLNTIGQVLGNYQISHVLNTSTENIQLANRLVAGIYQLEITSPTNKVKKITISVQ